MSQILKPKKGYKKIKGLFGETIEIPEEWDYVILDDLTPKNEKSSIRMGPFGSSLKTHELLDSGKIKTLWIENIVNNKFTWEYQKFISKEKYQELKGFTVKPNDILITMMGTLGKVAIVPDDIGTAIISSHLLKITLEQQKAIPLFLFYFLKSNFILRQIIKESRGLVMGGLNTGIIKNLLIKKPSISEQQKITTILSNVDELITSTQKVIEQTKSIKQGLMQKLLTKGIDHKKFKKVKWLFGKTIEIPEEWEITHLKNYVFFQEGPGIRYWQFRNSGMKMINVKNLVGGRLDITNTNRHIEMEEFKKKYTHFAIDEEDIVISSSGWSFGKIAIVEKKDLPLMLNTSVIRFKPLDKGKLSNIFLYYSLTSYNFQKQIQFIIVGTDIPNFGSTHLNKMKIILPTIPEQQKIASILSDVDSQIQSQIQYKEKLERLRKSLMQKLLTGEVRITI